MPLDFSPYARCCSILTARSITTTTPLPGAIELIRRLQMEKRKFACLSNSADSPLRVMMRLSEMGVEVDPKNIYTAAAAACDYVIERFSTADMPAGGNRHEFNLATESIDEMLEGFVDWVQMPDENTTDEQRRGRLSEHGICDAIIVGPPTSAHSRQSSVSAWLLQLARWCRRRRHLRRSVYPSPRGIEFGSGAISWMLAYAAGVKPVFCGKPEKISSTSYAAPRGRSDLVHPDRRQPRVRHLRRGSARRHTVLTLSGVTRQQDLDQAPPELHPDLIMHV